MEMKELMRRALSLGVVLVLTGLPSRARADDLAQIESANKQIDECDRWLSNMAYRHARDLLDAAERSVGGVDDVGKAPVLKRISERRSYVEEREKSWILVEFKATFDHALGAAEEASRSTKQEAVDDLVKECADILDDGWNRTHLDPTTRSSYDQRVQALRRKATSEVVRVESHAASADLTKLLKQLEAAADSASQGDFDKNVKEIQDLLAGSKAHGVSESDRAKFQKQLDEISKKREKGAVEARFKDLDQCCETIQAAIDGKGPATSADEAFAKGRELLAASPSSDPRTQEYTDRLAKVKASFDASQVQGLHDSILKPALDSWAQCQESLKAGEGWEDETLPTTLTSFKGTLGAKTESVLGASRRWLSDERVAKALERYADDPTLKPAVEQATKLRDTASEKILRAADASLDEAEKLPVGKKREELSGVLDDFKGYLEKTTGQGGAKAIARVDALAQRWRSEKDNPATVHDVLASSMKIAASEAWSGFTKDYEPRYLKLDAADAVKHPDAFKDAIVHFEGVGALPQTWEPEFEVIVVRDNVPICGYLDGGLREALAAAEAKTKVAHGDCEECVGVVEGVCVAHERAGNSAHEGVRVRILAYKTATIAVCVNKGTSLSRLPSPIEISAKEAGAVSDGSGKPSWVRHVVAWLMCLALCLAGALGLFHGACKFVPQLEEKRQKSSEQVGLAGAGVLALGILWFVGAVGFQILFGSGFSMPSMALILCGGAVSAELLRSNGHLDEETAVAIQPASIVLGLGCFMAAGIHFFFWDRMFF
jgi:hypothetical protein